MFTSAVKNAEENDDDIQDMISLTAESARGSDVATCTPSLVSTRKTTSMEVMTSLESCLSVERIG